MFILLLSKILRVVVPNHRVKDGCLLLHCIVNVNSARRLRDRRALSTTYRYREIQSMYYIQEQNFKIYGYDFCLSWVTSPIMWVMS